VTTGEGVVSTSWPYQRDGDNSIVGVMKLLATASLWFLAAWVVYDMSAYALGLPRQITPLIALAAAVAVGKALSSDGPRAATMSRLARIGEASPR
jgi:hypothetical protein